MALEQLKFEGLLSDQFISYYVIFQHLSFISSLFAFILTSIVIFRSSTRAMGTYKYFLLNEAYWNFIFDLFLALWQAATLFPAMCAFSGSVYFRHRAVIWTRYLFTLLAFASIGKAVSMTCVIVHRFVQTLHPNSRFARLYTQTTPVHQIWILLTCQAVIIPFFYISDAQEKSIRQQMIAKSDVMRFVYAKEPSTLCLIADDQPPWPIFVLAFIPCLFIVIIICVVLIYAHRNLRKRSLKVSEQKLELRLLLASELHLVGSAMFLFVPLIVFFISTFFPNMNYLTSIVVGVASTHSLVDCFVLIWFIRPYREYVKHWLFRCKRTFQKTNTTTLSMNNSPSVTRRY